MGRKVLSRRARANRGPRSSSPRALARNNLDRFDSAESMCRAWDRCFEAIDVPATGDEEGTDLPGDLIGVTRETPLVSLGLSPRLLNALDRLGAHTVAELVDLPRIRLYRNKGVGQRIVKLIRELSEGLAERLADSSGTRASATSDQGRERTSCRPTIPHLR